MIEQSSRILVIKLGALGDIVIALGPFAAIRRDHSKARITLLTTPSFAEFLRPCGYFDEIWVDNRPAFHQLGDWINLRRRLRAGKFDMVYDLQTSDRSGWYFRLMGPGRRPQWSGIARGCSHPHANPKRDFMHSIERQNEQMAMAGIRDVPATDVSWADADISNFALEEPFCLMVPGGASHRPAKRWPAKRYGLLAQTFAADGIQPVVLGTENEAMLGEEIYSLCDQTLDLTGKTNLIQIAALARSAYRAVGNDTGPMHMIAAAGCPSVVLFSGVSDPKLTAPRGPEIRILQQESLLAMRVDEVAAALRLR